MIGRIVSQPPLPVPQTGEPTEFRRRKPEESELAGTSTLEQLYDAVRMVDAEGYPHAFFERDGFRYELSEARLKEGRLGARVVITPLETNAE